MTERNYNLACGICPSKGEWANTAAQAGQYLNAVTTLLDTAGVDVMTGPDAEGADAAAALIAGETANRATFEADINTLSKQDCTAAGTCRLIGFCAAFDEYSLRGKRMVEASMAGLEENKLQRPE